MESRDEDNHDLCIKAKIRDQNKKKHIQKIKI